MTRQELLAMTREDKINLLTENVERTIRKMSGDEARLTVKMMRVGTIPQPSYHAMSENQLEWEIRNLGWLETVSTDPMETFYDITYYVAAFEAVRESFWPDSRERFQTLRAWAEEFDKAHPEPFGQGNYKGDDDDYLLAVDEFADKKIREVAGITGTPDRVVGETLIELKTQTPKTVAEARQQIRDLGMTFQSTPGGEYRVAFKEKGSEANAYYTNDLQDAVTTALKMARQRVAAYHKSVKK